MKNRFISLSILFSISLSLNLYGQNSASTDISEAADSIYLRAIEILGFRPPKDSKEHTKLSSLEIISHDAGAILSRIPAINGIRKGGGYGFDPVLRGFKYSQIGVLIDGIQTTTVACPNRMDPPTSQISVNTISNVEVYKGPYSLRYGNNIGGVINFLSSSPVIGIDHGAFSRLSTAIESNGNVLRTEALAGITGEKVSYQVAGSWHKGNDYHDGNNNLVPASFERANLAMSTTFKISEQQEIKASVARNFARNADYASLPMDLRSDDTWLIHLGHNNHLKRNRKIYIRSSAYASLVDHLMDNYEKQLDQRMVDAETSVKTKNFGARSELVSRAKQYSLSSGIDFNYENANGYRSRTFLMGPNTGTTINDNVWQNGMIIKSGIFLEYSSRKNLLRYNLSGRMNLNTAKALNSDERFTSLYVSTNSTQINPAITGGVEYLGKRFSYAFWAGRVQRSGNLSERFMNSFPVGLDPYELIGNPEVKSEVNNQVDLIVALRNEEKTKVEVDLFYSYLQNFISSSIRTDLNPKMPTAPGVRQYDNIQKASIAGMEITLNKELPFNLIGSLSLAAQLGNNLVINEPLPEIPPMDVRATLLGSYFQNKLQAMLSARYVLQQSRISSEFGETSTPSFFLIDIDFSYTAFNRLIISAGIRNIFNVAYYEHLNRSIKSTGQAICDPGRNIYTGISMKF